MSANPKDSIYAKPIKHVKDFVFDKTVANVFEDMITRSVPGYRDIVAMIGVLGGRYVTAGSHCYDLGCSLGAVTSVLINSIEQKNVKVIAVDNSEAMIGKCRSNLTNAKSHVAVDFKCQDILETPIENASLVVLNFVLQFIEPAKRLTLLQKIYAGLNPGGILILSEKIAFADKAEEALQIDLHHQFKKMHGYSDLEISQKRSALESVLIAEGLSENQARLQAAGFKKAYRWFQCFNFASLIAFK